MNTPPIFSIASPLFEKQSALFSKIQITMRRFLPHGLMAFLAFATSLGAYAQTYSFTVCGATGKNGPSQVSVNSSYALGSTLNGSVTVINNGIQQWTVPVTGLYRIAVAGASSGASALSGGGSGIAIQSDISLVAGQVLNVVVGQSGQSNASKSQFFTGGSGGGGNLLLAAGAGGGGLSSLTNVVASNISNGNFNMNGYTITDAGNNIAAGSGTTGERKKDRL